MMSINLPLGVDSFEKLRRENCYYIDKTKFIKELLSQKFEVNLITRPRRFGKTLTMSMLEDFFDIRRDGRKDFEGLEISKFPELCKEWMNQWPVIFLTLKSVEGNDFESSLGRLKILVAELCRKYSFLADSPLVNKDDRTDLMALCNRTADSLDVSNSLYLLTRMMYDHYGRPAIVLIDEYDVPLAKASEAGYYDDMMDVIRAMFNKVLKSNDFLKFAVVTGCLKIAKESIFTGTNNFVSDTITGDRFNEYIGFTEADVATLLKDTGFMNHANEIKLWYDGYRFGPVHVYCPWSVLNHVAALQINAQKLPQNYWGATSHNGIIYRFISREDLEVNQKFEILMSGDILTEVITEDLSYDTLKSSETNLWSLLYLTGYLTQGELPEEHEVLAQGEVVLRIPNEEVKSIFKTAIMEWFNAAVKTVDRTALFDALWHGDAVIAADSISDILFTSISYHDYQESYYHAFIAGLFAGAGYIIESNYERGTGRPDVVVKDRKNRRALVIEIKHVGSEEQLPSGCDAAIDQIRKRKYVQGIEKGYRTVMGYGIAFFEKECMVKTVS